MPLIIRDVLQGTEEWLRMRLGIPSASCFDMILTSTGKLSTQRDKYMRMLAAERIRGFGEEGYKNAWMERGNDTEAEACAHYEFMYDTCVERVGFVFANDDRRYGASPDGLIERGGLEIKCPAPHTQIERIENKKLPSEYKPQVFGNMLCAGADWWHFFSYCKGLPDLLIAVERDEEYIRLQQEAIEEFCAELDSLVCRISKHGDNKC